MQKELKKVKIEKKWKNCRVLLLFIFCGLLQKVLHLNALLKFNMIVNKTQIKSILL